MDMYRLSLISEIQDIRFGINSFRPRQNGKHFADDIFKQFLKENADVLIQISLKLIPGSSINNNSALV